MAAYDSQDPSRRTTSQVTVEVTRNPSGPNFLSAQYEEGAYLKNGPDATAAGPPNPLSDPAGMEVMMEGMKKNMMMIIPQTVIMGFINYFFSGFVLST